MTWQDDCTLRHKILGHDVRQAIRSYVSGRDDVSLSTYRAFVGMIETGEATYEDFQSVSPAIADNVKHYKESGHFEQ